MHDKQIDQMMQERAQTMIEAILSGTPIKNSDKAPATGTYPINHGGMKGNQNQMTPELQEQMKRLIETFGTPQNQGITA